jgi:Outer membrane protein beta-barrel domain
LSRVYGCVLLMALLVAGEAFAQGLDPPGPWVVDVRGATSGLPSDTAFFPPLAVDTLVPSRGFGFDVGAHVYLFSFGPARVGVGADYLQARGTSDTVTATVSTVAPQVSFNFGSSNGWSYLAAGLGRAWVRTTAVQLNGTAEQETGGVASLNFGGGARWFLTSRLGVGFDVRWHRLSSTPNTMLLSAAAGFSIH